jgi:ribosomal-protein-alanine N-acetyltransferase
MEPTILSTERLVLRPWQDTDVDGVLTWAADERFTRFLPLPRPYLREHAEEFVASRIGADWNIAPAFAVTLRGRLIGDVNARIEAEHSRAVIGYVIAPSWWGRHYTTEAAWALVDLLFRDYGVEKVLAGADAENVASWKVMENLRMSREALHPSHRILRGQRRSEVVYGVLRENWPG